MKVGDEYRRKRWPAMSEDQETTPRDLCSPLMWGSSWRRYIETRRGHAMLACTRNCIKKVGSKREAIKSEERKFHSFI